MTAPEAERGEEAGPTDGSARAAAAVLGVSFAAPGLLAEALTHGSAGAAANNQRLEFLGDRVLGLAVAERLMAAHPGEDEGALARRFAALVSAETLAEVARAAGLGRRLVMGPSEEAHGGRDNPAILGDACEAVIGALYLDGGLAAAAAFIDRHWAGRIAAQDAPPVDAKTELQEWTQARGLGVPSYRVLSVRGPDHKPTFRVAAAAAGRAAEAEGAGRRPAERAAAARLLARIAGEDGGDGRA